MPTYELTAKDGKTYDIDAESPEMALKAVEHAFGSSQPSAPAPKALSDLPDMLDPSGPDYSRRHGGRLATGMIDAIGGAIGGAGKAARGEIPAVDPATG